MEVILPFSIQTNDSIMTVVYLMGTFKRHTTVKALEQNFESSAYKSEKRVQVTTISVTEYWTELRVLYKKDFLIPFFASYLCKIKPLDSFSALP